MVQKDLTERKTRIFYRFLPVLHSPWDTVKILDDRKSLYVRSGEGGKSVPSFWKFETDGVFYNNSQSEVYDAVTEGGILNSVFTGSNGIILCFGQTYSGKTITTSGLNNNFEDRGIILRLIDDIFKIKERDAKKAKISVDLKYVEANRNYVRNLLDDSEELFDTNTVDGLRAIKTSNCNEAMQLIFKAETRKTVRQRDSYLSNMANSILTFIISYKSYATSYTTVGTLHIVDLAGADTEGNFSCLHKNGREVGSGNLAKTQLQQFLSVLTTNSGIKILVKQRLNVVIYYLREALNNESVLRFIGHVRATDNDTAVALSLLRFGQLIKGLAPLKLRSNFARDPEADIKMLVKELCVFKKEKDLDSMLNNEDLAANLSQDRYEYVRKLADDYLHDRTSELVILNTADAVLAMKVFKDIHDRMEMEQRALIESSKQKEETQAVIKLREGSVTSKVSKRNNSMKYSNNSVASVNKAVKKTPSKKNSKTIRDPKKEDARDFPELGQKSKQGSKVVRRRSSRRKSCDSSLGLKSEASAAYAAGVPGPPEIVPSRSEAWDTFVEDGEFGYGNLKEELDGIEQNLQDVYDVYTSEVENLKEVNALVNVRRDELDKANLLKDLDQTNEEPPVRTDLEIKCAENLKVAEARSVHQKEVVLKIQTELRLVVDCKNKIKADIERKYEEFCKNKYRVTVPDLNSGSFITSHLSDTKSYEISVVNLEGQEKSVVKEDESELNSKVAQYNKLRKFMKTEYLRRSKEVKKNKKWIKYCKLLG